MDLNFRTKPFINKSGEYYFNTIDFHLTEASFTVFG